MESTLSGRSMQRFLELARRQGYQVVIKFIFLETSDLCVQRVTERVRKGGHNVPEADIRRHHVRSMERFWSLYRPLADTWHLYFNSGRLFQNVAMATGDDLDILIPELVELFDSTGSSRTERSPSRIRIGARRITIPESSSSLRASIRGHVQSPSSSC